MSTRAIVGYKRTDGTVVGSWGWNDGCDIKNNLERDFKSLLDVNFLLEVGMFDTIYSQKDYEDFVAWAKEQNIDLSDKVFSKFGKSIIVQDKHHIGREPSEYKDMEDVLDQDINVAYIFEDGKWVEYR